MAVIVVKTMLDLRSKRNRRDKCCTAHRTPGGLYRSARLCNTDLCSLGETAFWSGSNGPKAWTSSPGGLRRAGPRKRAAVFENGWLLKKTFWVKKKPDSYNYKSVDEMTEKNHWQWWWHAIEYNILTNKYRK